MWLMSYINVSILIHKLNKMYIWTSIFHHDFRNLEEVLLALFHKKRIEQTISLTDEYIYIDLDTIQPLNKGNPAICDNIDEPWGYYAEWNKSEKDKHCIISLIYGIWKNKWIKTEIKMVVARGVG